MKGLNVMLAAGEEIQSGKIWVDPADGLKYPMFRKVINTGSLPNATSENTAHGIVGLAVTKFMRCEFWATNGTTKGRVSNGNPLIEVDATNVVVTSTGDLSAYTSSLVILEYCKTAVTV
jgi:hypothetical protein